MQIRRAEAADEEALAHIRRRAILGLAVPAISMEQAETWATQAAADRIAGAIRDHDVWVAVDGAAIGWVEIDQDRIAALYVAPSWARRGVGAALLACAETSIRSAGYAMARLDASQNARDFYLRRGYRRCGPPDSEGAYPLSKDLAIVEPNQPLTIGVTMQLSSIPFGTTDWSTIERTEHTGESGLAYWRTQQFGNIRVRMVEYTPGYRADHWCVKGHILLCLAGELHTTLADGQTFTLTPGMSYQVADNAEPHRSSTAAGATLFIVD